MTLERLVRLWEGEPGSQDMGSGPVAVNKRDDPFQLSRSA